MYSQYEKMDGKKSARTNSIAIIPARGGSKRIRNKNIRIFHGRPIIEYAIQNLRQTNLFERIVVSTDSEEIAEVSEKCGAEIPFLRPAELSNDNATTSSALFHALAELNAEKYFSFACCTYPVTPLLLPQHFREGLQKLIEGNYSTVFSATRFGSPIARAFKVNSFGRASMVWPEHKSTRSQDIGDTYHDAGQFYWVRIDKFLECKEIMNENTGILELPRWQSLDVDTPEDWEYLEIIYEIMKTRRGHAKG